MKIAVLDYSINSVEIIDVEEKWLESDLRKALPENFTDEEWEDICNDEDELIKLFLFSYCNYDSDSIYYLAECEEVNYYTPKDFSK